MGGSALKRSGTGASWAAALAFLAAACSGSDQGPGTIEGARRDPAALFQAARGQREAREALTAEAGSSAAAGADRRILFGDLHVHTTYSIDAFLLSLPVLGGQGAHPPAAACDYARHCAALDFYALTDHASSLTPEHWQASKESVRQCNQVAGNPEDPDLVAFAGFEWTQVGSEPENHFGHRNVIFPGDAEDALPARPIGALAPRRPPGASDPLTEAARRGRFLDPLQLSHYLDFGWLLGRLEALDRCDPRLPTRELPTDCLENASTPEVLHRKLDEWGHDALVIPHGTAWGMYTPLDSSLARQLTRRYHDPDRERLIELMSGHGSSEEYRAYRAFERDEAGEKVCPMPSDDHLACCWRAGEIMRERCGELSLSDGQCEARVRAVRQRALEEGLRPHRLFPEADWLDCDQCRDCFKPAYSHRPRSSVQYAMSQANFAERDEHGAPLRFRYGFVASSDDHSARPATGFKQQGRHQNTDARGPRSPFVAEHFRVSLPERLASFLYPGGVVAVHAEGRSREAIWAALARREVYGTSGPRILLWFDLLNESLGERALPMGSAVSLDEVPRFEVRAIGAYEQQPGCPEPTSGSPGLSSERQAQLCGGECYHPSELRHAIRAIEVVRILPQAKPGEPVAGLIQDPWQRFECAPDPAGCVVRFQDDEFPGLGRDAIYYVRALQESTPAINGANLRTEFDAEGNPVASRPCFGDYRTDADDDCLAPVQERAWSSPLFVDRRSKD